jgi:hypothetical protein
MVSVPAEMRAQARSRHPVHLEGMALSGGARPIIDRFIAQLLELLERDAHAPSVRDGGRVQAIGVVSQQQKPGRHAAVDRSVPRLAGQPLRVAADGGEEVHWARHVSAAASGVRG